MEELTNAQKGRIAIRAFKTMAGALALRGFYRPNGKSGQTLEQALKNLSPEIYDILTHITFLNIEAKKIYQRMTDDRGEITVEWKELEAHLAGGGVPDGAVLDQALWDLSILLGRTYQETRATHASLEQNRKTNNSNSGLFQIVYGLGKRMEKESADKDEALMIYFTPPLQEMIGHHKYAENWARLIKETLASLNLLDRPLHVISANLHSVVNVLYAWAALGDGDRQAGDLYRFVRKIRTRDREVRAFAADHGLVEVPDVSGAQIDCQIIDTAQMADLKLHPALGIDSRHSRSTMPVLLVMDYAFGNQAFEVMDELLDVLCTGADLKPMKIGSISIMGKAGILPGKKGDIMLATAHVVEGTTDNYMVLNDLGPGDFDGNAVVYTGPMVTVLGTSLQNRDVLERFQTTTWRAVGLEMEGGHYQRAISAAIIRGHIPKKVKLRYAYYASDNPLLSGQTLASGSMGEEGIKPTYMITRVLLEKILRPKAARS